MDYNVLPEGKKLLLKKEYRLRVLSVILFGVGFLFLLGAAMLAPSVLSVLSKERLFSSQKATLETLKQTLAQNDPSGELAAAKELLQNLNTESAHQSPSSLLRRILDAKAAGIALSSFTYDVSSAKPVLVLTGVAAARADLLAFQDSLKKIDVFETVNVPVGLLAKDTNITFDLTISGKI